MAIVAFYPEVADIELVDYKGAHLDENVSTDAITRVVITTRDKRGSWVRWACRRTSSKHHECAGRLEYGLMRIGE